MSERLGIERRKGVWCRCDAAEALTALGEYGEARRLLEDASALVLLGVDAIRTDFLTGHLMIRLGDFVAASEHLERARTANGVHLLDDQLVAPCTNGLVEVLTLARRPRSRPGRPRIAAADRLPAVRGPARSPSPLFAAAIRPSRPSRSLARGRERARGGVRRLAVAQVRGLPRRERVA